MMTKEFQMEEVAVTAKKAAVTAAKVKATRDFSIKIDTNFTDPNQIKI